MRKFTLLLASLFLTIGAMALTFVQPETGKYYKIKGDNSQYPWLMGTAKSAGAGVAVSANEADAAIFEKTENGLKVYGTETYLYYSGSGDVTIGNTESNVVIGDYNKSTDAGTKYTIKVAGAYMFNNNTDQQTHTSGAWNAVTERYWGFIEVTMENKVLADGVYTIQADENGKRGYLAISSNADHGTRPVLTEISWSNYSGNSCTTIVENSKYWYVKTIDGVTYLSNIGNGKFIYDNGTDDIHYRSLPYGLNVAKHNGYIHVGSGTGTRFLSMGCGTTAPNQVKWEKGNANDGGCLLTFTLVENGMTTYATQIAEVDKVIAGNAAAKAELAEAIAQAEALLANITIGDGVGEYSGGEYSEAELESLLGSANEFYNSITEDTEVAAIEANIEFVNGTMASYDLNMPAAGKYYAFSCVDGGKYVSSTISGSNNRLTMVSEEDNTTIYYYDGTSLLSYAAGQTINAYDLNAIGGTTTVGFTAANKGTVGKYNIRLGGRVIYGSGANIDSGTGNPDNRDGYVWTIKEVTSLPVTIKDAKYATFYAPVAVEVADGVTAYTVTINGEWATLTAIEGGVIPANTGVVLQGEAKTYNFAVTNTTATVDSDLTGTVAATYITADAYVLGYINEEGAPAEVGFGKAKTEGQAEGTFLNNSHKAYLPATEANNVSFYGFRFDEEENTTGIEVVENVNENVIYDLAGRRVSEITEKGIYIVNGKKVIK